MRVNQSLVDTRDSQTESLLQTHQCQNHGVYINNCLSQQKRIDGSHGEQCIITNGDIIRIMMATNVSWQ